VDDTTLDLFGDGSEPEVEPTGAPDPSEDANPDAAVVVTPQPNGDDPDDAAHVDDGLLSFMGESGANGADSVDGDTHPDLVSATVESGTDVNEANFAVNDSAVGTDVAEMDSAGNDLVLETSETESNLGDSLSAGNDSAGGTDVDEIDSAENDLVLGTPGVNPGDRAAPRRRSARQRKDSGSNARKVALVTGASRGIGRGIALALARERWFVVVNYAGNASAADETLEQVRALGGDGVTVQADIASAADRARLVAAASETTGRIDLLVNNAGVPQWERVLRTNLHGPFVLSRAAAAFMAGRGYGQIVNITSTAAKRAWPNAAAYHASKTGLLALSHAMHAELRPAGIKVTAVVVGGMATPFLLDRFPDIDRETLQDPDAVARAICDILQLPPATVVPEITILPMRETSWP